MRLRHRVSTPADFKTWLPYSTVRSRYGPLFAKLPEVWGPLLSQEQAISSVVEDLDAEKGRGLLALGLSVFVSDEFVREVKRSAPFWIGPELITRVRRNSSPILDRAAIRRANSQEGLNLFCWEADIRLVPEGDFLAVCTEIATAFFEEHAGFNIKELMGQHPFGPVLRAALQVGGWSFQNERGEYVSAPDPEVIEESGAPFVLGMTRELARKVPGCWLTTLFDYRSPRVFFTGAEQRLLSCALDGRTDDEIAKTLAISTSAVKKCWQSIYTKVGVRLPQLLPEDGESANGRGAEKKRRLLSYVRSHPEELRPLMPFSLERERSVPAASARLL